MIEDLIPKTSHLDLVFQNRKMLSALRDGTKSDFELESVLPTMRVLDAAEQLANKQKGNLR